jgi:hypothetical protein
MGGGVNDGLFGAVVVLMAGAYHARLRGPFKNGGATLEIIET